MKNTRFDKVLSFLLGASWGIIFFGALIVFNSFLPFGIVISIALTLLFICISLFLLLFLDACKVNREKLEELKKQTRLLEKLDAKERLH